MVPSTLLVRASVSTNAINASLHLTIVGFGRAPLLARTQRPGKTYPLLRELCGHIRICLPTLRNPIRQDWTRPARLGHGGQPSGVWKHGNIGEDTTAVMVPLAFGRISSHFRVRLSLCACFCGSSNGERTNVRSQRGMNSQEHPPSPLRVRYVDCFMTSIAHASCVNLRAYSSAARVLSGSPMRTSCGVVREFERHRHPIHRTEVNL